MATNTFAPFGFEVAGDSTESLITRLVDDAVNPIPDFIPIANLSVIPAGPTIPE